MVEIIVPHDIRYYKGKYRVQVILKCKGNYRVKVLEEFTLITKWFGRKASRFMDVGETFVTVPRLLWRHPRK